MVEKIESFRASNGTIHDNAHNAWRAELADWFAATGDVTEASAKKLVDRIATISKDEVRALCDTIFQVSQTAPGATNSNASEDNFRRYWDERNLSE
jgi:hypothetical protein